jgi:hypothetical protein
MPGRSPFGGGSSAGNATRAVLRRVAAVNVPGQFTSRRNSRGPVSQGDRPGPELMAIHELELDAFAQTGEQGRPVSGEDGLHEELVLVDQSQICQRQARARARSPSTSAETASTRPAISRFGAVGSSAGE